MESDQQSVRVNLEELQEQITDPDMVMAIVIYAHGEGPASYITSDVDWLAANEDKAVIIFEFAAKCLARVASNLGVAIIVTSDTATTMGPQGREDN